MSKAVASARIRAHSAFDPIWQSGEMSRSAAYKWLAGELGIPARDCHMLRMDEARCREVVRVCNLREFRKLADG